MNMVIPDVSKTYWLDRALTPSGATVEDWKIRLYQNDLTPDDGTVLDSFTEATFMGYVPENVASGNWPPSDIVSDIAVSTLTNAPVFTSTDPTSQTIYGWYMVGVTTNTLVACQRFDTPRVLVNGVSEVLDPFALRLKSFS